MTALHLMLYKKWNQKRKETECSGDIITALATPTLPAKIFLKHFGFTF